MIKHSIFISVLVIASDLIIFPVLAEQKYVHPKYGYSISIPDNWQITDSITGEYSFKAYKKDSDDHLLMLRIATEDGYDGYDANDMPKDYLVNETNNSIPDIDILDYGKAVLGGINSLWIEYTTPLWGKKAYTLAYLLIRDGTMYRITFNAMPDLQWGKDNRDIFIKIINSFNYQKSTDLSNTKYRDSQYLAIKTEAGKTEYLKKSQESWIRSLLYGSGRVFLIVMGISLLLGIGKVLLSKSDKNNINKGK